MLWSNGLKKQRRSAWYKQTPDRCQEMADRMRNGTTSPSQQRSDQADAPLAGATDQELIAELGRRLGI